MRDDHLSDEYASFACPRREERRHTVASTHPLASSFELIRRQFVHWWEPPGFERDWVELPRPDGAGSFRAWWQLPSRRNGTAARIEIADFPPSRGAGGEVADLVGAVGWWVHQGVPMTEARRWFALGLYSVGEGIRWSGVTQSVLYERAALDSGLMAQIDSGHWVITDTGFVLFAQLRSAGVALGHLGLVACAKLGLHEPISPFLQNSVDELDRALTRPWPGAIAADECPRGSTVGRRHSRAPGQVGPTPHKYRLAEIYGIRVLGARRREHRWPGG